MENIPALIVILVVVIISMIISVLVDKYATIETKVLVKSAAKFVIAIVIAILTVVTAFDDAISSNEAYMYGLVIVYAILEGMENWREYKKVKNQQDKRTKR